MFVILHRLHHTLPQQTHEKQAGVRADRGCICQISTSQQLLEHHPTLQKPTFIVLLDIRVAFNFVHKLLALFVSGFEQDTPIFLSLSNDASGDILQNIVFGLLDSWVELFPGNRVFDLKYADDVTLLSDDARVI